MNIFELAILGMIFVGFLGLIIYIAKHARSGD
jgi:preprotein translocase subunit Sss1